MAKNKVINTVLTLRDNMSGGLLRAAKNTKTVSKEMQSATRQVVAFKNKAVSSITSAAKTFGKLGLAAGSAVTALAAKTGLSEALDLEGYRLQLETATKDTEKAASIMQYAIGLANKTPFEGGQMVEAAAKFEAMGMSAETWLTRAGDMAAATNKGMDQATEALIDAQNGELERLKEFGITKAKILEQGEKMFAGVQIVNGQGQITNQEKFNDALIALMNDRFAGGMEKMATTTKGLWSTVTGVTKSALAKIAGANEDGSIRAGSALDLLKGKVTLLADKLQQWQADGTIDRLADKFSEGLGWAVEKAGQAFSWVREHGDTIIGVIKGIAGALVATKLLKFAGDTVNTVRNLGLFGKTVMEVGKKRLPQLAAGFTGALGKLGGFAKAAFAFVAANPIVLGIAAAIAAGVLIWKNWDKIKAAAGKLWTKVKDVFGKIGKWIGDKFGGVIKIAKDVADFFVGGFLKAINTIKDAFNWVKDAVKGAIDKVKEFLGLDTKKTIEVNYRENEDGRASGGFGGTATRNALGTSYWRGGLTRVNERGGEIMNLPGGTQIIPHDVSKRMASGPQVTVNVTVQGNVIGNRQYADELGGVIVGKVMRALANT